MPSSSKIQAQKHNYQGDIFLLLRDPSLRASAQDDSQLSIGER
jgi:hypothetical protein